MEIERTACNEENSREFYVCVCVFISINDFLVSWSIFGLTGILRRVKGRLNDPSDDFPMECCVPLIHLWVEIPKIIFLFILNMFINLFTVHHRLSVGRSSTSILIRIWKYNHILYRIDEHSAQTHHIPYNRIIAWIIKRWHRRRIVAEQLSSWDVEYRTNVTGNSSCSTLPRISPIIPTRCVRRLHDRCPQELLELLVVQDTYCGQVILPLLHSRLFSIDHLSAVQAHKSWENIEDNYGPPMGHVINTFWDLCNLRRPLIYARWWYNFIELSKNRLK